MKCSVMLPDPVDIISDEISDNLSVFQHPSGHSTLETKLLKDRYDSLHKFEWNMNLNWGKAVQFDGRESLLSFIADRLSKIFRTLHLGMTAFFYHYFYPTPRNILISSSFLSSNHSLQFSPFKYLHSFSIYSLPFPFDFLPFHFSIGSFPFGFLHPSNPFTLSIPLFFWWTPIFSNSHSMTAYQIPTFLLFLTSVKWSLNIAMMIGNDRSELECVFVVTVYQ
jgi:hypothetical protein